MCNAVTLVWGSLRLVPITCAHNISCMKITFLSSLLLFLVTRLASLVSPRSPPLSPLTLPKLPIHVEGVDRREVLVILIGQLLL